MNILVRLARSLPLVILLAALAAVVYFVVSWHRSPERAKEVLIKLFTVLTSILTTFFCLASAYAIFEANQPVLDLAASFAAVSALALVVTRLCRWRFVKNHPNYRFKPTRTWFVKR